MAQQRLDRRRTDAAAGARHLGVEIRFAAAVRAQILERQIESPLRQVHRDVADDVGQLQGDPEIGRVLLRRPSRVPKMFKADQADGRGDANAVLVEIGERLVAAGAEIHLDPFDQRLEGAPWQVESRDQRHERAALLAFRRAPVEAAVELAAPPADPLAPGALLRRPLSGSLVHRIVHGTAEVPHPDDGLPLGGRQHEEGIVEAGIASHG